MKTIRITIAALLLAPLLALAQLTTPQMTTLRTACLANGACAPLIAAADDAALADWLNAADATCTVWRHDVGVQEALRSMVWTEIDALTVGKARIWDWMSRTGTLDARDTNIRQGLADAFSAATATRTALIALAKRQPTRAERALSTGACTNAAPSIMSFTGQVSVGDASLIRSL